MSDILVCKRVVDMMTPDVASHGDTCRQCRRAVWVALSSPSTKRIMCWQCAAKAIEGADHVEVSIPTEAQLADLTAYYKRSAH